MAILFGIILIVLALLIVGPGMFPGGTHLSPDAVRNSQANDRSGIPLVMVVIGAALILLGLIALGTSVLS